MMLAFTMFFYVHDASTLVITTLVLAVQIFFEDKVVYIREATILTYGLDIIMLFVYVLVISLLLVTIRYISYLQTGLRIANVAQSNLLNGMHEGVLILDKKKTDNKETANAVLNCNWPAQKIFTQFIGQAGQDEEDLLSTLTF